MISLRSVRNAATLLTVALAATGLLASFNYASTAKKQILGTLDDLSPDMLVVRYTDARLPLRQVEEDRREIKRSFGDLAVTAPLLTAFFAGDDLRGEPVFGTIVYSTEEICATLPVALTPENIRPLPRNTERVVLAKALGPYFSGNENPAGTSILVNNQSFFIEGTFTSTDRLLGIDWQRAILAPFSEHGERRPENGMQLIVYFPQGLPPNALALAESSLTRIRNHKDFYVHTFEAMLANKRKIVNSIKLLTESISLIVLLMASVSCMNIFFVAVNERTREIGLRRALGATKLEIILLVMRDCYIFMAIGTILGLIGGYFFTQHLMRPLLLVMPEFTGWKFDAYSEAIGKTLAFVLASSSVSGLFPAFRAASTDPAVALRE